MGDQRVALSILQPASTNVATTAAAASSSGTGVMCQKRMRESYLYDRDGKRLKGLKGEAARLMHNHRFFSSEEEVHRLEQTLAAGKPVSAGGVTDGGGGSGGFGRGDGYKLPALPNMFGVLPLTMTDGVGEADSGTGTRTGLSAAVPPMHRWSLERRRHVILRSPLNDREGCESLIEKSPRISITGYRWVRADALHMEYALMSSPGLALDGEGGKEKEGCGRVDLPGSWLVNQLLLAPLEIDPSVLHAPTDSSPFTFFSVSYEEYMMLGLDDDAYQPKIFLEKSSVSEPALWRFDYNSTCKLLTLYERFGNFVVVADRWSRTEAHGKEGGEFCAAPSLEVMMERYRVVSETVLRSRLAKLQEMLKSNSIAGEVDAITTAHRGATAGHTDAVNPKDMDERTVAFTHPLTSLLEKHPFLEARRRRLDWLAQRYNELCQRDVNPDALPSEDLQEKVMLTRYQADILQQCAEAPSPFSPLFTTSSCALGGPADNKGENDICNSLPLESCLPVPHASPFWYDGVVEQARRKRLREELAHEANANVPYFRAVMAVQRVEKQARPLFEKLQALTQEITVPSQQEEQQHSARVEDPNPASSMGTGGGKKGMIRGKRIAVGKNRKPQHIADTVKEDSYQSVQEEVHRVPLLCERLKLCVQAGWFLPPLPPPSPPSTSSTPSPVAGSSGGGGSGGKTGGGTSNTSAVVNRALSNSAEAVLLSLPPSVARLHLGVEHELEKHLWEDHRALCDDSAEVQQLLGEVRVLYTQNVILRRFSGRCGVLESSLKKLASDAAAKEM